MFTRECTRAKDRLLRILGADDVDGHAEDEPLDLDSAACLLLRRYQQFHDVEAFALLCELTRERLTQSARELAASTPRAPVPETLVTSTLGRIFRGWRSPRMLVLSFFSLAEALMRRELECETRRRHPLREVQGGC